MQRREGILIQVFSIVKRKIKCCKTARILINVSTCQGIEGAEDTQKASNAVMTDGGALVPFLKWGMLDDNSVTEMRDDREQED